MLVDNMVDHEKEKEERCNVEKLKMFFSRIQLRFQRRGNELWPFVGEVTRAFFAAG